jgi:transketolase
MGIDSYGESAPAPALFAYFGLTTENVIKTVTQVLNKQSTLAAV